jgi:NAD+ kinase
MVAEAFIPQSPVITTHPKMGEAMLEAQAIAAYLETHGLQAPLGSLQDETLRKRVRAGEFDLLIAVGGDGTMLRAGHLCAPYDLPILGINLGRFGFLIQVQRDEWRTALSDLMQGKGWIEERMMLRVEHIRSGESHGIWHALNDAVVARGQHLRPVRIAAILDGHLVTTYVADGLIAATATGSTAYALAAGGPILPPEARNIVLVPIAPHLSVDRAVVLSDSSSASMVVKEGEAVLSVDGQFPVGLAEEDRIEIRPGEFSTKFIRFGDPGYFYRNLTAHMNQNPSTEVFR